MKNIKPLYQDLLLLFGCVVATIALLSVLGAGINTKPGSSGTVSWTTLGGTVTVNTNGNLVAPKGLLGATAYGMIYFDGNGSGSAVAVAAANAWTNALILTTAGPTNYVYADTTNDRLVLQEAGTYSISVHASFNGGNGDSLELALCQDYNWANSVTNPIAGTRFYRTLGAAAAVGDGGSGPVLLTTATNNATVYVIVRNRTDGDSITFERLKIEAERK